MMVACFKTKTSLLKPVNQKEILNNIFFLNTIWNFQLSERSIGKMISSAENKSTEL